MQKTSYLKPIYDSRQSFYNKAEIITDGTTHTLKSYNTIILSYNEAADTITFYTTNPDHFTSTTNRHINEFLQQYTNEPKKTRSQLLKMAINLKEV